MKAKPDLKPRLSSPQVSPRDRGKVSPSVKKTRFSLWLESVEGPCWGGDWRGERGGWGRSGWGEEWRGGGNGLGEQFQGRAETAPLRAADPSKGRRPQPDLLLLSLVDTLGGDNLGGRSPASSHGHSSGSWGDVIIIQLTTFSSDSPHCFTLCGLPRC